MPCDYSKYPVEWKQIRARIQERAKNRCEWCGVRNYAVGYRDREGVFHPTGGNEWHDKAAMGELSCREAQEGVRHLNESCEGLGPEGEKGLVIVCTTAHLNHDITDNRNENLAFLCQRCHIRHDAPLHARNAARTRRLAAIDERQQMMEFE